jgi:uncharacterized phage-associated protein
MDAAPPLSVFDAARFICARGKWQVTNLALQKILYLAHMMFMGLTGRPLVNEAFQAWDYGPVSPSLYQRVKIFGRDPIGNVFHSANPIQDPEREAVLAKVCDRLLVKSPAELVAITHRRDGAWARNYKLDAKGVEIPDRDILQEYATVVGRG